MKDEEWNTDTIEIQENEFVVEIGMENGESLIEYIKATSGSGSEAVDENGERNEKKETEETTTNDDDLNFAGLVNSWIQSCHGFLDAFPLFTSVAHFVNNHTAGNRLLEFLDKEAREKEILNDGDDGGVRKRYVLGRQHIDFVRREIDKRHQFESAEAALAKAQLLAVISEYEAFIADLLKIAIQITPEAFISADQTIRASTIIRGESLDQIREVIIDDHISSLQRGSHVEVIKTIFNKLKLTTPESKALREFGEICLRRNSLTHANGIVSRIYVDEMKKLGFKDEDIPPVGEQLVINKQYLRRSISRVFQMGYFTAQLVWQHLENKSKDNSVKLMINHSHDFLVAGYTKICGRICEFGLNPKSPANELDRAYLIVNLALSYFLDDKLEDAVKREKIEESLSKRDWSIVDPQFALALCCIREEYEKFGDLFDAAKDNGFDVNQFMSLAVFSKARNQPIFREKMLEHYGVEILAHEDKVNKEDVAASG